jgi:hypothetical protein
MRQDGVGANAQVSEEGAHITGREPRAPKLEHARGEMAERSLFRASLIRSINDLQLHVRPLNTCKSVHDTLSADWNCGLNWIN